MHGRESTLRMFAWLFAVAMVVAANGCAGCGQGIREPLPEDSTPGSGTSELLSNGGCPKGSKCGIDKALLASICPSGNCDTGGTGNAKGIYAATGGNYCFKAGNTAFFCPEAFVTIEKGLFLEGHYLDDPSNRTQRPVHARFEGSSTSVYVYAIHGDGTRLTIKYRVNGQDYSLTGAEVSKLILQVPGLSPGGSSGVSYELQFFPVQTEKTAKDGVSRYELRYRNTTLPDVPANWSRHCEANDEKADAFVVSFLEGQRVNSVSASVTDDATVTTMACESGSIVTCLAWGYTPWDVSTGQRDVTRDYVYRSCLQAKRAAYFVGASDFKSYTKKGTLILKRDQYGYGFEQDTIPRVEAIWGPQGAVCFNPENRRRPDAEAWAGQDPNNLNTHGVPPCSPADWSLQGKFATGPAEKQQEPSKP
ncbi:hypothetical protein DAT35_21040 [Vitiosangium sp. GDMCC 1.1324]|nr:hypothetical protein DAT35_21040 [Vitiosangium sp. GDMCC 1.1324]